MREASLWTLSEGSLRCLESSLHRPTTVLYDQMPALWYPIGRDVGFDGGLEQRPSVDEATVHQPSCEAQYFNQVYGAALASLMPPLGVPQ